MTIGSCIAVNRMTGTRTARAAAPMLALLAALMLALLAGGCTATAPDRPGPAFVDATARLPAAPDLHALDGAFGDFDRDGDLDLALAIEGAPNRIYRNDGAGRFVWVEGALGTVPHDSEHVRAADFDADGTLDLVFVAEDDRTPQLFLGRGDGSFVDASARLPRMSEGNGLAVGDVDGDGLADIVIGNSGTTGPHGDGQNFLWLNDRARPGWFRDATATHLPPVRDDTQGIALADLDGDGDLDMAVANERPPNRLYENRGDGRFVDRSSRLDLAVPLETREVHALDADGDGRLDLVFFNLTSNAGKWDKDPQTRLLIQQADGRFRDETTARMPLHRFSSWGGTVVDFDRDGDPDLLVGAIAVPGFEPLRLRAWSNDGRGRFTDVTDSTLSPETLGRSWSMAVGDADGDGAADVFVGGWGTQARLLLGTAR